MFPGSRVDSNVSDLVHINASEYFPKKQCIVEDVDLSLPFPLISGEYVEFLGRTAEEGVIALSNYRIFIQYPQSYVNLPVRMIEQADIQTYTNSIILTCKNGTTVRCSFLSADKTVEWQKRILSATLVPKKMEDLFAFTFYAWKSEERSGIKAAQDRCFSTLSAAGYCSDLQREAVRMKFDLESTWRLSEINVKYEISPTYPRFHIVPSCVADADLIRIAEFRSSRRFPSIVWRHRRNGSVIARSSQPELGFFGWRCAQDENFLQAITTACFLDRSAKGSNGHVPNGDAPSHAMPKLLILDARSYAAAVANRAKGGGSEYAEYYPNCEIQYMSMANIHTVRKSFFQLRQLCTSPADRVDFMSVLDKSLWLHHVSAIIKTTCLVTTALDVEARPALVHCSDGWDRTTQIVALAMLMLDSHYRTIRGFQSLIEWQWLDFGHKFADRCGHGANNDETERCPIFLQWLDCVFQLVNQFPVDFEFNEAYLIHVAHHAYSCLFGTFLCNNPREREKNSVNDRTYSLWNYLQQEADECFSNLLYLKRDLVLRPDYNVRNLGFWANLYIPELNPLSANVHPPEVICIGNDPKIGNPSLPRTRSVENLTQNLLAIQSTDTHLLHRASSESNIALNVLAASENGDTCLNEGSSSCLTEASSSCLTEGSSQRPSPGISALSKSVSLPNGTNMEDGGESDSSPSSEEEEEGSPNGSQSAQHLITALCLTQSVDSQGSGTIQTRSQTADMATMERSTDTITGDDGVQTLLLERYPSNGDVRSEDEELDLPEDDSTVFPSLSLSHSHSHSLGMTNGGRHNSEDPSQSVRTETGTGSGYRESVTRLENGRISESLITSAMFPSDQSGGSFLTGTNIPRRTEKTFLSGASSLTPTPLTPTPLKMVEVQHHHSSSPINSPTRPRRTSRHLTSASSSDSLHDSDTTDSFQEHNLAVVRRQLGADGLAILHDERQIRLRQIRDVYQREVDTLRRELISVKSSLRQYNGYSNGTPSHNRRDSITEDPLNNDAAGLGLGLGVDVVDHYAYGTSCGSDVSWDNIDDKEAQTTPWVPDQCVTKCTSCESRFWLGKRKHHCRKCGLVFCSNCSDYQIPLPQDRLYSPVRVCRSCHLEFHKLNNGIKTPLVVHRRHPQTATVNSSPTAQPTHA